MLFVSGFVSTEKKWIRFDQQWRELMSDNGLQPPFHMKDFVQGKGQYASIKQDKEREKEFMRKAIGIIKRNTHKSFSSGVVIADFEQAQREFDFTPGGFDDGDECYDPYTWNALKACLQVQEWMVKRVGRDDPVRIFFELGDLCQGRFVSECSRLFGTSPIFLDKKDYVQFDAADLVAWEHRRLAQDVVAGRIATGHRIPRGSYLEILKQLPHEDSWTFWDREFIEKNWTAQGAKRKTVASRT